MQPSKFLENLKLLTLEELKSIKGIGAILAQNIIEYAGSIQNTTLIEKFKKLELNNKAPELQMVSSITTETKGVVCITGTFDMPRPQIKSLLESKGYKVVDTVTKTTTILLAGEEAGSKKAKAEQLGIEIKTHYTEL
jgi:DNA ligase (NAD+)